MPYFVNVGSGGRIRENKSKVGARGYHVFRRGRTVVCRWAGIVVERHGIYRWRQAPAERIYRQTSEKAAREFIAGRLRALLSPTESYSPLPRGVRIQQFRRVVRAT